MKWCLPLGAGYKGISYTGALCNIVANGDISATINSDGQVGYQFPDLAANATTLAAQAVEGVPIVGAEWLWTDNVL